MKKNIICSFIAISSGLFAGESKISADIQMMNGTAKEYVRNHQNGDKMSRLDWKIKNIPILNLGYEYSYNNWEFSVLAKKNIKNNIKSGTMKDYDWYYLGEDGKVEVTEFGKLEGENLEAWKQSNSGTDEEKAEAKKELADAYGITVENIDKYLDIDEETGEIAYIPEAKSRGELSNFSETKNYVKDIIGLDLAARYYVVKSEKIKVAPMLGLNYDRYRFYSTSNGIFEEYFPGVKTVTERESGNSKGITYKQRFLTPYLGANIQYSPNSIWDFNIGLKGSLWGRATAQDKHLAHGANETLEKYKNIKFLLLSADIRYHWNESLTLKGSLAATKYFYTHKGSSTQTLDDGKVESIKNGTGLENKNFSYSLGFEYKF